MCLPCLIYQLTIHFLLSRSWLHDAKNRMRFLKMHYAYNLIVTEKSMTSITFIGCFLKRDVCAT